MKKNPWARLLAYVTGLINQELFLKNEYLSAENRILRPHLPAHPRLSDPERATLAEIGKRLGRKALSQVACVAKPDTILAWHRKLIAQKFDGSKRVYAIFGFGGRHEMYSSSSLRFLGSNCAFAGAIVRVDRCAR